jgi:demethylmenaquinone methyltransferase/2-methoxy-6-polyprenyl-1,4-benzoquinol methylase
VTDDTTGGGSSAADRASSATDRASAATDRASAATDWGRRLYDWYGDHASVYGLVDRASRSLRQEAVETLDPAPGDVVVDIGCGPGSNVGLLRERVGPSGTVLGVDYSAGMVRQARRRVASAGWTNVAVVQADAARLPFSTDSIDGAAATLALSAMPAAESVASEVARVLRPGGRLAVMDADLRRETAGVAYPLVARLYRRLANWQADVDVPGVLGSAFDEVREVARYDGGTAVVVSASVRGSTVNASDGSVDHPPR